MLLLEFYSQRQTAFRKWKVQSSIITSFQVSKRAPLCPKSSSVIKISGPVFGPLPPKACGGNIFCTFSRHCLVTCCDCPDVIHTPTFVVAVSTSRVMCVHEVHRVIVWALLTLSCHPQYLSVYESELSRLWGGLGASAWIEVVAILLPFCLL